MQALIRVRCFKHLKYVSIYFLCISVYKPNYNLFRGGDVHFPCSVFIYTLYNKPLSLKTR